MASPQASGTSTSGTPGTVICTVTASTGKELYGWFALGAAVAGVQNSVRVVVTYFDATTSTFDTDTGVGGGMLHVNAGGKMYWDSQLQSEAVALAKAVTKLEVQTLGTGVLSRWGIIGAEEAVWL